MSMLLSNKFEISYFLTKKFDDGPLLEPPPTGQILGGWSYYIRHE